MACGGGGGSVRRAALAQWAPVLAAPQSPSLPGLAPGAPRQEGGVCVGRLATQQLQHVRPELAVTVTFCVVVVDELTRWPLVLPDPAVSYTIS